MRRSVAGDRRGQIQCVLHVARGMLGRHVQRVEAVPVVFGLGALDHGEAHAREDGFELVANDGQGVPVAEQRDAAGQGDVDAAGRRRGLRGFGVLGPACVDRLLQLVGVPPDVFLLIGGRSANQLHPRGDDAVLAAEIAVADGGRIA